MNESGPLTSLRNERKPCHFWVDNEVADCYQPIVGADAIWVYCRIARNAHGAWIVSPKVRGCDTRVSLREMAEWCGKSVDTVWRCLQVLELVGLLQAVHGAKSAGRYALADVKDLVVREGAQYDREVGSFRLPDTRVAELKEQVCALRVKLARKKATGSAEVAVQAAVSSVAQSDRLESDLFGASESECDRSVAQSDATVAHGATASITTDCKKASKAITPQPPQAGECGLDVPKERNDDEPKTKDCPASVVQDAVPERQGQQAKAASDFHSDDGCVRTHLGGIGVSGDAAILLRGDRGAVRVDAAGSALGRDSADQAVVDLPLDEQQLAHLARYANDPENRKNWEDFYRMQNREEAEKAAQATTDERAELERVARLKVELCSVSAAVDWVMRQCRFVRREKRGHRVSALESVIEAVLRQEMERGEPLWKTAPKMAEAWKKFKRNGEYIDVHWGPVKFFELAIWSDERGWAWNSAKLERLAGACVGSAR